MTSKTILAYSVVFALAPLLSAQTKISGTAQCGKSDPMHTIEVGDRPGHSVSISKVSCTWTKPWEIDGVRDKEGTSVAYEDIKGNRSNGHGYFIGTMGNGDKYYVSFHENSILKDGALESAQGKWSFTGGTGRLKGIKGGGLTRTRAAPRASPARLRANTSCPRNRFSADEAILPELQRPLSSFSLLSLCMHSSRLITNTGSNKPRRLGKRACLTRAEEFVGHFQPPAILNGFWPRESARNFSEA